MAEEERRQTITPSRINDAKRIQVNEGQHVFRERESGDAAFVVLDGKIAIYRTTEQGDHLLATLGKGAMFGEMALIDNQARMASAKAIEGQATVLVVTRDAFKKRMDMLDPFTRGLIKILTENIRTIQKD
jgi:CRP/FNR family transcriptional regulator, cyclic AMP receptor protein